MTHADRNRQSLDHARNADTNANANVLTNRRAAAIFGRDVIALIRDANRRARGGASGASLDVEREDVRRIVEHARMAAHFANLALNATNRRPMSNEQ